MVDSMDEKTPRGVSGLVSGSSGLQVFKYYQEKGRYRICWTGPAWDLVYTAWWRPEASAWQMLQTFNTGTDSQRKQAAEDCCREHWQSRKANR